MRGPNPRLLAPAGVLGFGQKTGAAQALSVRQLEHFVQQIQPGEGAETTISPYVVYVRVSNFVFGVNTCPNSCVPTPLGAGAVLRAVRLGVYLHQEHGEAGVAAGGRFERDRAAGGEGLVGGER